MTTYSANTAPGLTLDGLRELMRRFEALPPVMVEVWCFDCTPDAIQALRGLFPLPPPTMPRSLFSGVPLYEWESRYEKPGDKPRPDAFTKPGVYAKMSDGTWRRI